MNGQEDGDETFEADDGDEEGGRFFGGGINSTQEVSLGYHWTGWKQSSFESV